MKSEERHALQQNELEQEYVGHLKPFLERHGRLIALLAAAVVLLFVAVSVWRGYARTNREAGWATLLEANSVAEIEAAADEELSGKTNATVWAHLLAGKRYLATSYSSSFNDRAAADDALKSARTHFEAALAIDDAPAAAIAQARYGLANVEEATSEGDPAAAIAEYERLLEEYPQSPLVPAAERRLEILRRPTTGPFLAWFEQQNPEPQDAAAPIDRSPADPEEDALIPGVSPPPAPGETPAADLDVDVDAEIDTETDFDDPPPVLVPDVPSVEDGAPAPETGDNDATDSLSALQGDEPAAEATASSEDDASEEPSASEDGDETGDEDEPTADGGE